MKKVLRNSLIFLTASLLVGAIGYSSFLIFEFRNKESQSIDNTFNVVLTHLNEDDTTNTDTITLKELEEDSYFDLPILSYDNMIFNGWSIKGVEGSKIDTYVTSVKDLKTAYSNLVIENNTLELEAIVNTISEVESKVLLNITDSTDEANPYTYYMIIDAAPFLIANIRYVYTEPFVEIRFNNRTVSGDIFDATNYAGQTINVMIEPIIIE